MPRNSPSPSPHGGIIVESPRRGFAAVGQPGGIVSFHQVRRLIDEAGGAPVPVSRSAYLAAHDDDPQRLAYVVMVVPCASREATAVVVVEYTPSHIYMLRRAGVWCRAFRCRIAAGVQIEVAAGMWMEMHDVREGDRIAVDPSGYALADHTEHEGAFGPRPPFVCRSLGLNPPKPPTVTGSEAGAEVIRSSTIASSWLTQPIGVALDVAAGAARISAAAEAVRERERRRARAAAYAQQSVRGVIGEYRCATNNRPTQEGGNE